MAVTDVLSGPLPEVRPSQPVAPGHYREHRRYHLEWYDFLLHSVVTGLVFGKLSLPTSEPLVGVLQAFAVYAVGFLARPIGAAIFGHYGDRIGRKATGPSPLSPRHHETNCPTDKQLCAASSTRRSRSVQPLGLVVTASDQPEGTVGNIDRRKSGMRVTVLSPNAE